MTYNYNTMIFFLFYFFLYSQAYEPGIDLKVNSKSLNVINELLSPLILTRYSGKDYNNLNFVNKGSSWKLKLLSFSKLNLDPLWTIMKANIKGSGFDVVFNDLQGFTQFSSEIEINGKSYKGIGQLLLDGVKIAFTAHFIQKGANIELAIDKIDIEQHHIDVIYSDPKLNKTLNSYKKQLREAYSEAIKSFMIFLVSKFNTEHIHNLILPYASTCGFNVTMMGIPIYDKTNDMVTLHFDGGVVNLPSMKSLNTKYCSKFQSDIVHNDKRSRILISDKTLEGLLVGCKSGEIQYEGRVNTVQTTLREIPEIFSKYSKSDKFYPRVSLVAPLTLQITQNEIIANPANIIYNFTVQRGSNEESVFSCKVKIRNSVKITFANKIIKIVFPSIQINDVSVISSNIDLKGKNLKSIFQNIIDSIKKEINDTPFEIDFTYGMLPGYIGSFFTIKSISLMNKYLSVNFD